MLWLLDMSNAIAATGVGVDPWGCVYGSPPDSDGDTVEDEVELAYDGDDGDTDEDGCPDVNDPDDDGDGRPTALDKVSDNVVQQAERPWLEDHDPFDNDYDGFLDARFADELALLGLVGDDCGDSFAEVHPGLDEVYYNNRDEDCVDGPGWDQDGDGFEARDPDSPDFDCDDLDPATNPAQVEDDGPEDRDCDGFGDPPYGMEASGGCSCDADGARVAGTSLVTLLPLSALARRRRWAR